MHDFEAEAITLVVRGQRVASSVRGGQGIPSAGEVVGCIGGACFSVEIAGDDLALGLRSSSLTK